MPVVPWSGEPPFGGKTLVIPGSALRGVGKRISRPQTGDDPAAADPDRSPGKTN